MADSIEIDSPLPGDTVGTTVTVSGVYSTTNAVPSGGVDQVECEFLDSGNAIVVGPLTQSISSQSGSWSITFTVNGGLENHKFRARLKINGAFVAVDTVDEIDTEEHGGAAVGAETETIP